MEIGEVLQDKRGLENKSDESESRLESLGEMEVECARCLCVVWLG